MINPANLSQILRHRAQLHVLFWIVLSSFYGLGFISKPLDWYRFIVEYFGVLATYAVLIYYNLYFSFDWLLLKKRKVILSISSVIVSIAAIAQINVYIFQLSNTNKSDINAFNFIPFFTFLVFFVLSLKIAKFSYLSLQDQLNKTKVLLSLREQFLKTQLQPHFLFNVLSNFYSLALQKSSVLPELIISLSELLRYQYENDKNEKVPLAKEIEIINHIIGLERLRIDDTIKFDLQVDPSVESLQFFIAPSLLSVFVENAIKHTKQTGSQICIIEIKFKVESSFLIFSIKNNYDESSAKYSSGVGLELVKERLDILYQKKYQLDILKAENIFNVFLKLPSL